MFTPRILVIFFLSLGLFSSATQKDEGKKLVSVKKTTTAKAVPYKKKKQSNPTLHFPEEKDRRQWDRGCENWALNAPVDSFFPPNPLIKTKKEKGSVLAWVHLQADPEPGETKEQVVESLWEVMSYGPHYPQWGGNGINDKRDGSRYFVTFDNIQAKKVEDTWDVFGKFDFSLILFNLKSDFKLQMASYKEDLTPPNCKYFNGAKRAKRIFMRMAPNSEIVKLFVIESWVVPSGEGAKLMMYLVTKPINLVYQVLPVRILKSEIEARLRRMMGNILEIRKNVSRKGSSTADTN